MYRWNVFINFIVLFTLINAYNDDCFVNEGGYICCDHDMVKLMQNVMQESGGLLNTAKNIQTNARSGHGKFETVVAFDDYAYKHLFKVIFLAWKACKVSKNGIQAIN
ncbi:hypothetical protein LOAG_14708 [Loa loa]|uniref:Ground-like domain-containing protein n=1 Tax=Loa loa TaxID=7209 RepID=A0A1S0THD0_LOALO|nr:hypothetical protein LOAG_14708 [Loa loa]EFO13819.1 hypothetical protein LOAG_14708 [Loa loa]